MPSHINKHIDCPLVTVLMQKADVFTHKAQIARHVLCTKGEKSFELFYLKNMDPANG